jgi:uncharacterized protein (DUF1501 family)
MTSPLSSAPGPTGEQACCTEYGGLTRRGLLRAGALVGAAGAAGAVTATFGTALTQTAYAATGHAPATVVVLSLRGAADGLSLVVPHADPVYYAARPRIAVPRASLLATDAQFGLHPAFGPLLPLWQQGRMAAVHAVGLPAPNRSHFAAMEEVEDADPGSRERIGWLNRLVGRHGDVQPLRAVQMGSATTPASLAGPIPTFAAIDVDSVRLAGEPTGGSLRGARARALQALWGDAPDGLPGDLGDGVRTALRSVREFRPVQQTAARPANGARYPDGDLGDALGAVARTIRADVGAEVVTVDHGPWDMHRNLGTLAGGDLVTRLDELARALAAFFTDLGALGSRVTVVTVTEFGRRIAENANLGTDHGHGSVMLLLGAGVKGGYHGRWVPLRRGTDEDVPVTTDFRSVLAEVVTRRLGASSARVFPGFVPEAVGAVTG